MKILKKLSKLFLISVSTFVAGVIVILPIIASAQPSSVPTGGNVDANFDTVKVGTDALDWGAQLQVANRINVMDGSTQNPNVYLGDSGSEYMQIRWVSAGNYGHFFTPSNYNIALMPGGNVGVGTTSPIADLHVQDSGSPTEIRISGDDANWQGLTFSGGATTFRWYRPGWGSALRLSDGTTDVISVYLASIGITDQSPDARIDIFNDTTRDSFRIDDDVEGDTTPFLVDADGNVGIGTANPSSGKLVVQTNSRNAVYAQSTATGAGTTYGGFFSSYKDTGFGVYGQATGTRGTGVFGEATSTAGDSNFGGRFTANGSAGIGVAGYSSGASGHGVYGSNTGGGNAGYFSGNVTVTDDLDVDNKSLFVDASSDQINFFDDGSPDYIFTKDAMFMDAGMWMELPGTGGMTINNAGPGGLSVNATGGGVQVNTTTGGIELNSSANGGLVLNTSGGIVNKTMGNVRVTDNLDVTGHLKTAGGIGSLATRNTYGTIGAYGNLYLYPACSGGEVALSCGYYVSSSSANVLTRNLYPSTTSCNAYFKSINNYSSTVYAYVKCWNPNG